MLLTRASALGGQRPSRLARIAARTLSLAAIGASASCGKPLSQAECGALLDRYVTLLAGSDRPGTTEAELVKLRASAREKAARDPEFKRCASRVSRRQYECALRAESTDRLEQCLL